VTVGIQPSRSAPSPILFRLIVFALLPILTLFPPETDGWSMAGCASLIALLVLLQWRSDGVQTAFHALLVAGTGTAAVLASLALVPAAAVEPVAIGLVAVAAGLAAAWSGGEERFTRAAVVAVAIAAACVALYALHQKFWGLDQLAEMVRQDPLYPDREAVLTRLGRGRAFALFETPAGLGGCLAIALPATVGLAISSRGKQRWVWSVAALIGSGAFLAAASATAAAALVGAVALALLIWSRSRRSLAVGGVALLLLLAGVAWQRGGRVVDLEDQESPWRLRAGNIRAAAAMAAERPWTGVGPGGFAERYPAYRRPGDNETQHVHSLPFELVAEWGWPAGAVLAVLFFTVFLQPLWRQRRGGPAWRRGLAIGLAAFALQNLGDFTAFMPSLLWVAAMLRGRLARIAPSAGVSPAPGQVPVLVGASLVIVVAAVGVLAAGGLAADARVAARAAAFAGESDRALRLAERAARLAPWDANTALLLARVTKDVAFDESSDEPMRRQALDRVDRAVRLAPVKAAARDARARVRQAMGDVPGALADWSEAARLYPMHEPYAAERDALRERLEGGTEGFVP
jgi:tetratricopeptide (TPR) repeat protein